MMQCFYVRSYLYHPAVFNTISTQYPHHYPHFNLLDNDVLF